ncbi:uncharacterized protein LOC115699963 [Cannabis sativa]|uniref:uncharacterized protein LOC115699963 n=1 Tax=Cannabis sativa TaxID=3483 RepID=UPI0029CA20F4|nr:uncharacterized protein LOC115699963 [Cannabis sativa]
MWKTSSSSSGFLGGSTHSPVLMHSLQKDMLKQKANYEKKLSSDVQHECKYTTYGFAPAVQYWAYEAILEVGKRYGTNHGIRFPRMLSWTSKGDMGKKDISALFSRRNLEVVKGLLPRTEEEAFVRTISYDGVENPVDDVTQVPDTQERDTQATGSEPQPSAPSSSGVRGAEYTDLVARLDRIEADTQGLYAAQAELKKAYETSHVELKGGQNVIMEQLRHILAMLNRPPTTASTRRPQQIHLPHHHRFTPTYRCSNAYAEEATHRLSTDISSEGYHSLHIRDRHDQQCIDEPQGSEEKL